MVNGTGWRVWTACRCRVTVVWGVLLMAGLPAAALAQDGDLDVTFGMGGKVITDLGTGITLVTAVATQTDGKIVVAATAGNNSPVERFVALLRYDPDGSLDPTFGTAGRVDLHVGILSLAGDAAIQADGKILVVGDAFAPNGNQDFFVARLNPDGSLDSSFSGGIVTTDVGSGSMEGATAVAIQSNGRIVAAGRTRTANAQTHFAVVRYHTDGTLDTSFSGDGIVVTSLDGESEVANDVALQGDGKIVVVGASATNGGPSNIGVVRYDVDGLLDTSFDLDGIVLTNAGMANDTATGVVIQANGRIIVAGSVGDPLPHTLLIGYQPNGALDGTFGTAGVVKELMQFGSFAFDVALQADGKIVTAGQIESLPKDVVVARFGLDGSLDDTFGQDGIVTTDFAGDDQGRAIVIQADGRIVVAGHASAGTPDVALARYEGPPAARTLTYFLRGNESGPSPSGAQALLLTMSGVAPEAETLTLIAGDTVTWTSDLPVTGSFLSGARFRLRVPCQPLSQLTVQLIAVSQDLAGAQELATANQKGCTGPVTTITLPVTPTLPITLANHTLRLTLANAANIELTLGGNAFLEVTRFQGVQ